MQDIEKFVPGFNRIRQQELVVERALFNLAREGQHSGTRIDTGALPAYSPKKHEFLPACLEQHMTRAKA